MRGTRAFFVRLGGLFRKERRERDLTDEIESHLALNIEDNLRAGMSPEEARREALVRLGGVEQTKESYRDRRGLPVLESLVQDLRYGLRMMRRSPGFTAVAVLSLALGIGANTAIFGLIDQLLLRRLPVRQPERLVKLTITGPREFVGENGRRESFGYRDFEWFRAHTGSLSGLIFSPTLHFTRGIAIGGAAENARAILVAGAYFPTLGVKPALGRLIAPEDEASPVAVVSYRYWKRRFGLDPAILGKPITFNRTALAIVGVAPQEFFGLEVGFTPDIFVPVRNESESELLKWGGWLQLIGRLETGVRLKQAEAELNALYRPYLEERVATAPPEFSRQDRQKFLTQRIELAPAGSGVSELRRQFSEPLLILMSVVGLVLGIACANIANLQLARVLARQREMSVRFALGACRGRLVRQLITESTLLAALGGVVGLIFTCWIGDLVIGFIAKTYGWVNLEVRPDPRILAFTAGVSLVTGVLFGLAPALRGARGRAAYEARPKARLGKGLVVLQVGMSLTLVAGATLFVRTLRNLQTFDAGFARDRILLFSLSPPGASYKEVRLANLYGEVLARLRTTPGVLSASFSTLTPVDGGRIAQGVEVDGFTPRSPEDASVYRNTVSPGYFDTLGIPVLLGRDFSRRDTETGAAVAVVNDTLARFYFRGRNPLGRRIRLPDYPRGAPFEIIGVVGDTRYHNLRAPNPRIVYLPYTAYVKSLGAMNFAVRTAGDPTASSAAVREQLRAADKEIRPNNVRTLAAQIDESLTEERLIARASSAFGLLALLLASIGLYGVMSCAVKRRTAELGIRMALGAGRGDILWMVSREVLALSALGIAGGVPVALASARLVANRLFGVEPSDPLALATAAVVMTAVALLAGYLPARRASRVDPMVALRCE